MKIALVVHDLHEHGGHSLYAKTLADELSSRHEVTVFSNRCERPVDAFWSFQHVPAWRKTAASTVKTFPVGLRTLAAKLAECDIRHTQGYCGGTPNIVTAHICVAAYLDSLREISLRTRASLKLMATAEQRFYRRYGGPIIAISEKIGKELRDFYDVRGEIIVIPHGVDSNRFSLSNRDDKRAPARSELDITEDHTVALYVGDLTKAHTSLKALSEITPDTEFIIVSPSTRYQWQSANVHFVPATSEIERWYAAADAFVFPSTYDAFGMVVLEAMASGLPVLCSDQAGAAELIHPGEDGFVIPLAQWVETTRELLNDRDKLDRVGRAAEETARVQNWTNVVRQVEQVYLQTITKDAREIQPVKTNEYRYQQY